MKQPKALKIFFLTEMWERLGFYISQTMLIFYMIQQFSFSDSDAYAVLGQFTAFVYLGPIVGGWVSDKFLGNRYAVILGGLLFCLGYTFLAWGHHSFFIGISLVILGNSFFKPNISSFLGQFYTENDPRREAGFTLFYVGINVGSLLAATSAGYIKEYFGWMACFGTVGFMLLLAVGFFRWGYRFFEDKGLPPLEHAQTFPAFLKQRPSFFLWLLGGLTIVYFAMTSVFLGNFGLYLSGILFFCLVVKISLKLDSAMRRRIWALLILFVISAIFWAFWFQVFFVVNLFVERAVDRTILGHSIPAPAFAGLDSLFVLLLGPVLAWVWKTEKIRLSTPAKFMLAILFAAMSMQILALLTSETSSTMLPAYWIILFYFVLVMGEMLLSPIGLSMVTEFAPKEYTSLMMGGFFMSLGFGGKLTGIFADYASVPAGVTDVHTLNMIYHNAFQHYAWYGFIAFIVCLLFLPLLQRWLKN